MGLLSLDNKKKYASIYTLLHLAFCSLNTATKLRVNILIFEYRIFPMITAEIKDRCLYRLINGSIYFDRI